MKTPMLLTYRMFIAAVIATMPLFVFAQVQATDDYAHTTVNAVPFAIKVLLNDKVDNAPNNVLKIDKIPLVNHGSATVNADRTEMIFTPAKDFKGVALVNYTVTDGLGHYACGLVTVDVSESPLPNSQTLKLFARPREKIIFTVPKDFQNHPSNNNPQGSANWVGNPGSGVYCFTAPINFSGIDPVGYLFQSIDKFYNVEIYVVGSPLSEFLKDDYVYLPINSSKKVYVHLNDSLPKPVLNVESLNASSTDCTIARWQDGSFQIMPNPNFKGTFNFDYKVTYVDGTSETATVHTTVANFEPVADNFEVTAYHGVPYEFKYNIPIDNGGSSWSFIPRNGGSTSAGGSYIINSKGEIVYTPPTSGESDSFEAEYCVSGSGCKIVTINVNLQPATAQICSTDCVFPGDANRDGIVDMWDLLTVGRFMGQYGSARADANLSWMPTSATNWQQKLENGVNAKNADMNGDGIVSHSDTTVISANFGKINSIVAEKIPEATKIELQVQTTSNAAAQGDMIEITVLVGTAALPAVDARGLTYSVGYDADLIQENTLTVDFLQSNWLSRYDAFIAMSKIVNRGRIESGIARSQNRGVSGHGEVSKIRAVVIDDPNGFHIGDKPVLRVRINDVYMMDAKGRMLQIQGKEIAIPIKVAKKDEPMKESDLLMFPNPSSDYMSFYLNGVNSIESLRVLDMMGKEVNRQNNIKGKQATVYFDNYTPGMYIAEVMTEKGKIIKKIQVVK